MTPLALARAAALAGYFGLITLLLLWFAWLAPPRQAPPILAGLLMVLPLLAALNGVIRGRAYTHAWLSLLALAYLTHGLLEALTSPALRPLAALEVILSLCLYLGAAFFARFRARQDNRRGVSPAERPGGRERREP